MPNVSKPNRKQLTPEEKTEIEEAFDLFDSDRDKLLDRDEFKVALKARLLSYLITNSMNATVGCVLPMVSILPLAEIGKLIIRNMYHTLSFKLSEYQNMTNSVGDLEFNLRKHLVTQLQKKNSQKSSNNLKINLLAGM